MKNEIQSTVFQALIELQRVTGYEEVTKLMERLEPEDIKHADENLKQHQYPDSRLSFVQFSHLNKCPQLFALFEKNFRAYTILTIFVPLIGKDNLVTMPLYKKKDDTIPSVQSITKYRRQIIVSALEDLHNCGFIATYKKPSRYNQTIFMVNPLVVKTGNQIDMQAFWDLCVLGAEETFNHMGKEVNVKVIAEPTLDKKGLRHHVSKLAVPDPELEPIHRPAEIGPVEHEIRAGQEALEELNHQLIQDMRDNIQN